MAEQEGDSGSPRIDLRVPSITVLSPKPQAGKDVLVEFELQNAAGLAAKGVSTGFHLSTNSSLSDQDLFLGTHFVPRVDAVSSTKFKLSLRLPSHVRGPFYVGAIADYLNSVTEVLENNNGRATAMAVAAAESTVRRVEFQPRLSTSALRLHDVHLTPGAGSKCGLAVTAPGFAGKPYTLGTGTPIPSFRGASRAPPAAGVDQHLVTEGATQDNRPRDMLETQGSLSCLRLGLRCTRTPWRALLPSSPARHDPLAPTRGRCEQAVVCQHCSPRVRY